MLKSNAATPLRPIVPLLLLAVTPLLAVALVVPVVAVLSLLLLPLQPLLLSHQLKMLRSQLRELSRLLCRHEFHERRGDGAFKEGLSHLLRRVLFFSLALFRSTRLLNTARTRTH